MNDNRRYHFSLDSVSRRGEYPYILEWVKPKSKVIDLGCGDGSLLDLLRQKKVKGEGIEVSPSGVKSARAKGLSVKQGRIDVKLPYGDKVFDVAVCNVTVQMVAFPDVLLSEMRRIAKRQIVTFPNFGFGMNRFDMLMFGRMPHPMLFGYTWLSTGHVHQLSIADYKQYCRDNNLTILDQKFIIPTRLPDSLKGILGLWPNFFATTALFLTQ